MVGDMNENGIDPAVWSLISATLALVMEFIRRRWVSPSRRGRGKDVTRDS